MPRSKGSQMKKDMEVFRGPPKERLIAVTPSKHTAKKPIKSPRGK